MRSLARFLFASTVLAAAISSPPSARAAGAVLAPAEGPSAFGVDVRVAVAVHPWGTTRWSQITLHHQARALWLVPVRPGATLDWASPAWLEALDGATRVRVAPPTSIPPCGMPAAAEPAPAWSSPGTPRFPTAVHVLATESEARAHAAARGFAVGHELAGRIAGAYSAGWQLVSFDLATSSSTLTSPTLRVSDSGGAHLPFALTGASTTARVTAFVLTDGAAAVPSVADVDAWPLTWTAKGSTYAEARTNQLAQGGGSLWLREAASHRVLFDGVTVPLGAPVPSVAAAYFAAATGQPRAACVDAARAAASGGGTLGRVCAQGALGQIAGGDGCVPTTGTVDASAFVCGSGVDDLALALAGRAPGATFVTRLAGIIPGGALGRDEAIASADATERSPILTAKYYETCTTPAPTPTSPPSSPSPGPFLPPSDEPQGGGSAWLVTTNDGCGGSTSSVYESEPAVVESPETDDDTSSGWDTGDDDTSSGWDTGDDDTSSGWDTGDDDTSSDWGSSSDSESCSGTSSSSSSSSGDDGDGWDSDDSSDSCSGTSSSSSSGDDGWDTSSAALRSSGAPPTAGEGHGAVKKVKKAKKPGKAKKMKRPGVKTTKRSKSPVSRYAILAVAIVLPLRRRWRQRVSL